MWRLLIFLFPFSLAGQSLIPEPGCTKAYFNYVISALAHDSMEGRMAGSIGEKKAAEFIAQEFRRIGCRPLHDDALFYPFTFLDPDSVEQNSYGNVVSKIGTKGNGMIVIGAHYDHLGMGNHHSRSPFIKAIHNGADDNASGVAMMLGLAAWCNMLNAELKYDMVFVAFSAEEDGLYGSHHFLTNGIIDTSLIRTYLNFDMLGRLNETNPILKIEGLVEHPYFEKLLPPDSLAGFQVRKVDPIFIGGSDNYSFENEGISGLSFSTGIHDQYHTPDDDLARINFEGMEYISLYLQFIIEQMQQTDSLGESN